MILMIRIVCRLPRECHLVNPIYKTVLVAVENFEKSGFSRFFIHKTS